MFVHSKKEKIMKKVRNLLILLLAALMLTVFVGCDNNKGLDELPPEEETPDTPTQEFKRMEPGDLIISKYYLGENNDKMFVISNVGSDEIDLARYQIGMRQPGKNDKYTSLQKLPAIKLPAGKSLYVANDHKGSLNNLFKLFPNIPTLPKIDKDATNVIAEDSYTTVVPGFYGTDTTVEIVTNVGKVIGKDGSHDIYGSWDIVDTVLVDDKIPGRPSALVRDYDAATHTDNGWISVIDDLSKLNPAKGSVKPSVKPTDKPMIDASEALKISRIYIGPNGYSSNKFFAVTNMSDSKWVDLATVKIGMKYAANDTRLFEFPNAVIAPGSTIYFINGYGMAGKNPFNVIMALPRVDGSDVIIEEDSRAEYINAVYKGNCTFEIVDNVVDTGEKKDGKYTIYSWNTLEIGRAHV